MSDKKPVVVYGASGYTGRLVCEFLRQYNIPFVAAGRDAKRIQEVMDHLPGVETADYEVVAVENDVDALTKLFEGRKVVCNIVGPFERYGHPVVQAALNAGVHYLDTTGEPAFVARINEEFSDAFAKKGLALAPSTAYMYVPAEIAARIAMDEDPTIDTLDVVTAGNFVPTFASTQSIFNLFSHDASYLKNNEMAPWTPGKGYEVPVPGYAVNCLVHPWGGGFLPTVFKNDPRIHTCRQFSGNADRELMENIIGVQQQYEETVRGLPTKEEQQAAMDKLIDEVEPFMPPREMTMVHRSCDIAVGNGSAGGKKVVIQSTSPYTITGLVVAATSHMLIHNGTLKAGFCSGCEAVGHNYLLAQMRNFLPVKVTITDT